MLKSSAPDRFLDRLASHRWFSPLLAGLLLGAAVWLMTRAWDASLLDRYQFRQTQTALNAYWMRHDSSILAYPLPIFGPPWSVPHEFPLYQWLVARVNQATGLPLVPAARIVGIIFFLLSLPAVYGLAGLVERDPRRRLLVPAAVLVTPVCLFYSRTFMIESCACALAVWFLYAHVRNLQQPNWRGITLTATLGVLAALVKITTFALFGAVAVIYTIYRLVESRRRSARPAVPHPSFLRLGIASALPALLILAVAIGWIAFSDAIKRANPYAAMLTSANLHDWLYGTIAQRLDPAFWRLVGHEFSIGVLSGWMVLLLAAAACFIAPVYRRAALLCAAGFLIGPLFFSNLYFIHEYYYFPSAYFAAAAAGLVLAGIFETSRLRSTVKALVLLAFFGLQAVNFNGYYAFTLRHLPNPAPPLAKILRLALPGDGIVLIHGWDWNTLLPYYAQRRAILVPLQYEDDVNRLTDVLTRLRPAQVSALIVQGPHRNDPAFIKWRTSRLNLSSTPVARSVDGDLYLPADAIAPLQAKLKDAYNYPGVQFDFSNPPEPVDPRLHYQKVNPATYAPVASPAPFAVFNPWSVDVAQLKGETTIFANAPSELHFHVPPGASRIEAIVGLNDGAYTAPNFTDGVDVVIFEHLPGGGRRVLYQRYLDPVKHAEDRGPQSISLQNIGPVPGPLIFAIYPGPADNLACDWGYWRHIRIH
ncbi:MAG: glycosyltransferase family 39 protein [Opitutaceae bacterium]